MDGDITYKITTTGSLKAGFEAGEVVSSFAALFKIPPEKARLFLVAGKKIKDGLNQKQAELYRQKLEKIGLDVLVESNKPAAPAFELALEPTQAEEEAAGFAVEVPEPAATSPAAPAVSPELSIAPAAGAEGPETANSDMASPTPKAAAGPASFALEPEPGEGDMQALDSGKPAGTPGSMMICPKCKLRQEKAEQCAQCGVFVEKIKPQSEFEDPEVASLDSAGEAVAEEVPRGVLAGLPPAAIMAACGAAVLGAIIWKVIAISFDYELGLIAWIIGGAIGGGAQLAGGRGNAAGIFCGLLALVAIFAGKYLAYQSIQEDFTRMLGSQEFTEQDYRDFYAQDVEMAKYYVANVDDIYKRKEFMVNYQYTDAPASSYVSDQDVQVFLEENDVYLKDLAVGFVSFEQWKANWDGQLVEVMEEISTFDLVKESLGLIDLVFMFLGIGTAFQLGRGRG